MTEADGPAVVIATDRFVDESAEPRTEHHDGAQRAAESPGSAGQAVEQESVETEPVETEPVETEPVEQPEADEGADPALDDPAELAAAIEAILFVVDAPLTVAALASALRQPTAAVEIAVVALRTGYDERVAGIELRDAAGGLRIYTRPVHARHVERFLHDGQRSRLSQAALETLAVIAYRQPVTRSRVSAIRGVNVDGVVRTLLSRGLIVEVGSDPESGAGLFRTSELFLERMGMQTLEELPSLAPLLPDLEGLETEEL
jgi:segregation and condensation protein B